MYRSGRLTRRARHTGVSGRPEVALGLGRSTVRRTGPRRQVDRWPTSTSAGRRWRLAARLATCTAYDLSELIGRLRRRRGARSSAAPSRRGWPTEPGRARRAGASDAAARVGRTRYRDRALRAGGAVRRADLPQDPRRPRLRLVADTPTTATRCWPRRCTTTPSTTRSPSGSPGRRLVGVMGGHALRRDDAGVRRRRPVRPRRGRRRLVATGGGPGAMEAANLGAYLAGPPATSLAAASRRLAAVPAFRPSIDDVAARPPAPYARSTRTERDSLGIPTWHYGHEPTNVFATDHRQVLPQRPARGDAGADLRRRDRLPAGQRRHRPGGLPGRLRELLRRRVVAGADGARRRDVLDRELPAWPLLQSLARGRPMEKHVHLVDSVEEAAAIVGEAAE